jgi:hypothetical protein
MRAVGRLSYSWYLWHWPLLILAPQLLDHRLGLFGSLGAVITAAGLAMLTLWLVEDPLRFATPLRRSAARSLICGGAFTAAGVCIALLLLVAVPVPVGRGAAAPTLAIAAPGPIAVSKVPSAAKPAETKPTGTKPTGTKHTADTAPDPGDTAVAQLTAQVQTAVAASAGLHAVPSNLTPSLADAAGDKADVFVDGCVRSWRDLGQPPCVTGDTGSATTVALVGDSHAAMWNPAFEQVAAQRHWRLETLAKVTCPLMDLPITSPYLGRGYTECVQWREEIVARLQAERPQLIVIDMSRRYGGDFGFVSYDPAWVAGVGKLVARLRGTGATVLLLGAVPDPHTTAPACLSGHLDDATACAPTRAIAVNEPGIAAEQAATTAAGGQFADLTSLFCTADRCPLIIGNDLVFRDDNHITVSYARTLAPVVAALADRALAPGRPPS